MLTSFTVPFVIDDVPTHVTFRFPPDPKVSAREVTYVGDLAKIAITDLTRIDAVTGCPVEEFAAVMFMRCAGHERFEYEQIAKQENVYVAIGPNPREQIRKAVEEFLDRL